MLGQIFMACALFALGFSAPTTISCPEFCSCTFENIFNCTSIEKIQPELQEHITKLTLSNVDLAQLNSLTTWPNLKQLDISQNALSFIDIPALPHLTHLNLSRNYLTEIPFNSIPKTVEFLDLSYNVFTVIPTELLYLEKLKTVNFYGNPIICSCDKPSYDIYSKLVATGVEFTKNVECDEAKGQHLASLKCNPETPKLELLQKNDLDDILNNEVMMGDEPKDEEDGIEQGFIMADNSNINSNSEQNQTNEIIEQEGSGDDDLHPTSFTEDHTTEAELFSSEDEGSGFAEEEEENVDSLDKIDLFIKPICQFNCSNKLEEKEEDHSNETEVKEKPSFGVISKIFLDDLTGATTPAETTTTSTTPTPIDEEVIKVENVDEVGSGKEVEEVTEGSDKVSGDLERQLTSSPGDQANTAYIVVAALVILIVGLILYVMIKRKTNRARARENGLDPEKPKPVEMKELLKKPVTEVQQPAEKAPLLNGQNGKAKNEDEEQNKPEADQNQTNGLPKNDEEVELRKPNENLLTPEMQRVTVQAKELTVPKTPVLVNRSLSSEGKMVSTNADSP